MAYFWLYCVQIVQIGGKLSKLGAYWGQDHLTSFAVLMHTDPEASNRASPGHQTALSIITYVGIGLSLACIGTTLALYGCYPEALVTPKKILLHLCIALALSLVSAGGRAGVGVSFIKFQCGGQEAPPPHSPVLLSKPKPRKLGHNGVGGHCGQPADG